LPDDPTLERPDDPNDTARLKAVLVLVAAVAFAVMPFFTDPFTGFGPDRFPVPVDDPPIQPAGWAFAIWGVIYLWLLASAGFGLIKRDTDPGWDAHALAALRQPRHRGVLDSGRARRARAVHDPHLGHARRARFSRCAPHPPATGLARAAPRALCGLADGGLLRGARHRRGGLRPRPVTALSWAGLALALILAITITRALRVPSYPLAVAWALAGIVAANATEAPGLRRRGRAAGSSACSG
jgi:hypothetical protein